MIKIENPYLRNFIRNKIGLPRYGNALFDYVVEEAFVRMQYVLDLTPQEFLEDLENLNSSLNKISYAKLPDKWAGVLRPSTKEIQLNNDYFIKLQETTSPYDYISILSQVLIHELLHAMQTNKFGQNRAEIYNKSVNNRGHAIYEICTDGISIKCSINRRYSDMKNNRILDNGGYSNELFAIPLLAATFGVSEKTILKYGVRERYKLIEACNKNIGNTEKTGDYLFRIENKLELIHSIFYPDDEQEYYKNLSEEQKQKESHQAFKELISICGEVLAERIQDLPGSYNKNSIVQLAYDYKKIIDTATHENKKFGAFLGKITKQEEYEMFYLDSNFSYSKTAIEYLKALRKKSNRHLIRYSPEIINSIKNKTFDECQKHKLQVPNENTMSIVYETPEFLGKIGSEDYNDFDSWDNSNLINVYYHGVLHYKPAKAINPNLVVNAQYTDDYYKKMNDLRVSLLSNNNKSNINITRLLSKFLTYKWQIPSNFYEIFNNSANKYDTTGERLSSKKRMKRSFKTQKDQVFLADVMAERFLDTAFNSNNIPKHLEDEKSRMLQHILLPDVQQYGRGKVKYLLKDIMLNDNYPEMSSESNRINLAVLGQKQITDIVAKPLVDELLNKRRIIPEKKKAMQNALASTERWYPQTLPQRLAIILENFKKHSVICDNLLVNSNNSRSDFKREFNSPKDMEDMLGLICDAYSAQYYSNPNNNNPLIQLLNDGGPDYFRENIIKAKLYDNYSGLYHSKHIESLANVSIGQLVEEISIPFINESLKSCYYETEYPFYFTPNFIPTPSNRNKAKPNNNMNTASKPVTNLRPDNRAVVTLDALKQMSSSPNVLKKIPFNIHSIITIFNPKTAEPYKNSSYRDTYKGDN